MSTLKALLSFSHVRTHQEALVHARTIAEELLLNWKIKSACGSLHTFEGLEFYLSIPHVLEDDVDNAGASHKRKEQLTSSRFYVHTKSKGDRWSLPIFNRHGVDITCGNPDLGIYAGILIRHIGGKNHQDGSGRALRVLLRGDIGFLPISRKKTPQNFGWSEKEKMILQELNGADIFRNSTGIELVPSSRDFTDLKIIAKKRIGIEKTKYANELLRFCTSVK
ncbi:hypothetical protein [Pseudobdellovibrio exovorus]|uniref:Uncharacterized protein n=1 Tax=Pseudobdellovibrio exovorus JSS TaxID=1184267 RepID=M4VAP9_9BACT|nr:hypothetical protein [Pseudobdellovibrio exovorus]AGH95091.1 hypothetical protein A11Q_875 [Pseudobdellovibrio exovorus JSS]